MPATSRSAVPRCSHWTLALVALVVLCAASFGAIAQIAWASHHYHVNCVPHGFVHGSDSNDTSFHSRVEYGCGSATKRCAIYSGGFFVGRVATGGTTSCNAWSSYYGMWEECSASAQVEYVGVFSEHIHLAANWCG